MNVPVPRVLLSSVFLVVVATVLPARAAVTEMVISSLPHPAKRLDPPRRSFDLVATGDVLTESPVTLAAGAFAAGTAALYDFAPLFAPIMPMLSSADIAICHMEMPIGAPGQRIGVYGRSPFGGNLILAPYEIADSLRRVGFDRCSTASNHSNDLGEPGIDTTLAALDGAGISHAGTARYPAEAATSLLTSRERRPAFSPTPTWAMAACVSSSLTTSGRYPTRRQTTIQKTHFRQRVSPGRAFPAISGYSSMPPG